MANGFSIQGIKIEGFKGFSEPVPIDFNGRHIFLLGPNGNGKSSIVEAIRWGLFGSTFRPNETVDNLHYPGDCRVTIKFMSDEDLYTLERTLFLGGGSTSSAVLKDEFGQERQLRTILPQLNSVDAGERAHIIFAPQSAPLTKQPEDIEPFERTIYNYLGLTHSRALMSNIDEFLTIETKSEEELDGELTDARSRLDSERASRLSELGIILEPPPPWGSDSNPPSTPESEHKVRRFVQEITGASPDDDGLAELRLTQLLGRAQSALNEKREQGESNLVEKKGHLAVRREHLERLRETQTQVAYLESSVEASRTRLRTLLAGHTVEQLRKMLKVAEEEADTEEIKRRIFQYTYILLARSETDDIVCPICNQQHSRDELDSSIQNMAKSYDADSTVTSLTSQIEECERLDALCTEQESELEHRRGEVTAIKQNMDTEDKRRLSDGHAIDRLIEDYEKREAEVSAQIIGHETWLMSRQAELNLLKEEGRFHSIRESLARLDADSSELEEIEKAWASLVVFRETVGEILDAVKFAFSEQFRQESPRVSDLLSQSFNALTQHPWYDRLEVVEGNGKLEYRVASTQDSLGLGDPTGVLNGQAESALNLVPYFALSQREDDTPTAVFLVMMDDPTRALDTEHIRILVERLGELGKSVQLVVASQETERFQELIPQAFDQDSYVIVEPTGWTPRKSPSLSIRYV